jgi:hypothetical protein
MAAANGLSVEAITKDITDAEERMKPFYLRELPQLPPLSMAEVYTNFEPGELKYYWQFSDPLIDSAAAEDPSEEELNWNFLPPPLELKVSYLIARYRKNVKSAEARLSMAADDDSKAKHRLGEELAKATAQCVQEMAFKTRTLQPMYQHKKKQPAKSLSECLTGRQGGSIFLMAVDVQLLRVRFTTRDQVHAWRRLRCVKFTSDGNQADPGQTAVVPDLRAILNAYGYESEAEVDDEDDEDDEEDLLDDAM